MEILVRLTKYNGYYKSRRILEYYGKLFGHKNYPYLLCIIFTIFKRKLILLLYK
jgi:hypothetical protein